MSTEPSPNEPAARSVALVCTELRVGGAERCVTRLACGLDRRRFSPRVIAIAARPAVGEDSLVTQLEDNGVPVEFLGAATSSQLLKARRQLRRQFEQQPVDLVQSFLFHANVLSLYTAPKATPVATGIRVADPRRWRHFVERHASKRAAAIVCVSDSVRHFCADVARFPADKLQVIPNGISLDGLPAAPAELPQLTGRRLLLCVGRLDRQKGYDWLLSQLRAWLDELPEHDLAIAGEGPDRRQLESLAAEQGLASRVHFLGQRVDVPRLLAAADLLLLPSRWEGMPNVVLEAMASSRPVLAARAEGVLQLLGDLSEHQSAAFGDAAAWQRMVVDLARDPARGNQLGQQNRRRVERHFQISQMIAHYEALWTSILAKHGSPDR